MKNTFAFIVLMVFLLSSCTKPDKLENKIIGTWSMENVYEYGKDVTEKHNPYDDRWIEFKTDGTFISDGKPFGRNSGLWKADNENNVLYLDSEVDDDDSEWKVTFEGNTTTWTGIGHPRKENTRLIHRRKDIR